MALFRNKQSLLLRSKKKDEEDDDELDPKDKKKKGNGGDEDDDGDEIIPKSLRRKRIEDKEFKDLKAENKKKRKEPPKPWGKKERLFVLIALLVTAGGSGFLALSSREWKLAGVPRIEAPKVEVPFMGSDTIVIEGKANEKETRDAAVAAFKQKTERLTGVYGLSVVRLSNGYSYGVNDKEEFTAASLMKLPVMAALFAESEKGNVDLDSKYTLQATDKVGGSGSLYGKPVGYEITYRNILALMGKQSDNTAFRIARNKLGDATINDYIKRYGMTHTSLDENTTTPQDIAQFYEGLWTNNIISKRHRDELLDNLTDTIYEAWLAAGIPTGTKIAHKFGRETHVINDAGIVFAKEPFVIVVMSKGIVDQEGDTVFPELGRSIFEIESNH
jgi:beta-lactamase class A